MYHILIIFLQFTIRCAFDIVYVYHVYLVEIPYDDMHKSFNSTFSDLTLVAWKVFIPQKVANSANQYHPPQKNHLLIFTSIPLYTALKTICAFLLCFLFVCIHEHSTHIYLALTMCQIFQCILWPASSHLHFLK